MKICSLLLFLLSLSFSAPAAAAESALPEGTRADRIVVEKGERRLTLFCEGKVLKRYRVALGGDPVGPKQREGDQRTPEGLYIIDRRKSDSLYHLALHISYPGPEDIERARRQGVPPGGDIMIHGLHDNLEWVGELHRYLDWTRGCVAVTNSEIEELWRVVPDGTPIEIRQ